MCWLMGRMQWASAMRRMIGGRERGSGRSVFGMMVRWLSSVRRPPTACILVYWCGVDVDS